MRQFLRKTRDTSRGEKIRCLGAEAVPRDHFPMQKISHSRRLGYCCVNLTLGVGFKTIQLTWSKAHPEEVEAKWRMVVRHNLDLLGKIVDWNISQGIWLYRVTGEIVPFGDHPELSWMWKEMSASEKTARKMGLVEVRNKIKKFVSLGGRISSHPAQYVSIASVSEKTRESSRMSLEYHAELMSNLGTPTSYEHPINIHVSNGSKGESVLPLARTTLKTLSKSCMSRLVFENEQSGFWTPGNISRCFPEVPVTLDYHHHLINPTVGLSLEKVEKLVESSWGKFRPICHWSQGRRHEKDPAHSDYITCLPETKFDIEVEAKAKDLAILPFLSATTPFPNVPPAN